jgi:sec-independent protein translocase protein TatA
MGVPSMPELLVILVIILLLFGAKKIPDLAKGLGGGIKNFKEAMKDEKEEEVKTAESKKVDTNANTTTTTAQKTEETKPTDSAKA